ncbi:MAG: CoA activase, partial [Deltaproteobacteria bacterium]|nr:CoA activase [Deltaproteobacteria bacterium]
MAERKETSRDSDRFHVGIDAGSVSLNAMVINREKEVVYEAPYTRHLGRVEERVLDLIENLYERFGEERIRSVSFTGNHGKKVAGRMGVLYEFETISQVLGCIFVKPDVKTIISMGGQETALFQINHSNIRAPSGQGDWDLAYFNTNGPCASGTGSFIEQQAERLATAIYSKETDISQGHIEKILADFIKLGLKSRRPANVACRCTVFTKSDMIHLQNKGEKLEDIIHGLHVGNARNYMSAIVSNRELQGPILFIGGLSLNELQVRAFKNYFPGLIAPRYSTSMGALGVALQALESDEKGGVDLRMLKRKTIEKEINLPVAPRLALKLTTFPQTGKIIGKALHGKPRVYLGVDIGSTTTKYALINEGREMIHKQYVPTQGKPVEVTQRLFKLIIDDLGDLEIAGTATTGSGRHVVGDFLNADLIIDEITAHARGAVEIDAEVDTIFEIGGQDSKYISLSHTYPLDFDMNKVCAAGTGSFLHELANKYGIHI